MGRGGCMNCMTSANGKMGLQCQGGVGWGAGLALVLVKSGGKNGFWYPKNVLLFGWCPKIPRFVSFPSQSQSVVGSFSQKKVPDFFGASQPEPGILVKS